MIRVGPAGWSYADWEGIVYPRDKPAGFHPLRHLARYVEMMEVNSSFYATPRADYAARWVQQVADKDEFRFTAKLQNVFTHERLPDDAQRLADLARAYRDGIEPLVASGKLAALLVQFPLSFRHSESSVRRLERIAALFDRLPLVLEVRHRTWFDREALGTIEGLGYSLARIDLPEAKDHPPADPPVIGPIGYVRLHGRNRATWFARDSGRDQRYDYLYSPAEISEIVQVVRRLSSDVDDTFVVTNNHFSGKAVANALEIMAGLGKEPPLAPIELVEAFPRLKELTRPHGQPRLF